MSYTIKWCSLLLLLFSSLIAFSQEEAMSQINHFIEEKNWEKSIQLLQELEKKYPTSSDIKFKLAQVYFWNGNKNSAFDKVSEIPESVNSDEILRLKIQIQQERKQYNEVIQLCNFGISKYENTEFYYMQQTIAYTELKESEMALSSLSQVKVTQENKATIAYLKNEILQQNKNFIIRRHCVNA